MKVQRICQHCNKEFTAQKTTTKFCSLDCARRAYKANVKQLKIEISNKETRAIIARPIEEIKSKEFLTVRDAAKLINCSVRTTYRLINQEIIKAINLSERKTLIKRSDIDNLFI
jgi:excisionase family DNA binding protein